MNRLAGGKCAVVMPVTEAQLKTEIKVHIKRNKPNEII
jgi:hypothetical protein